MLLLNYKDKNAGKTYLFVYKKNNQTIIVEKSNDSFYHLNDISKQFGKPKLLWIRHHKSKIKKFEKLENCKLIEKRKLPGKARLQIFVHEFLLLRILADYDLLLSYSFVKHAALGDNDMVTQLNNFKLKIQTLEIATENSNVDLAEKLTKSELKIKQLQLKLDIQNSENVVFDKGECLFYAFLHNQNDKFLKFGTSFNNKNGQRLRKHKQDIPNMFLILVFYSEKKNLTMLNSIIKARFPSLNELAKCDKDTFATFVQNLFDVMDWKYVREDQSAIDRFNTNNLAKQLLDKSNPEKE